MIDTDYLKYKQDLLGFTRVIELMAKMKKPVISHNGVMDMMFLYDKFNRPLPESVDDFTQDVNQIFPHIYDTKHMINSRLYLQTLFPNSSLSEVY